MNRSNLTLLRQILTEVEARGLPFSIAHWAKPTSSHPCGTAACAAGYYALDPRGQATGLSLYYTVGGTRVWAETPEAASDYLHKTGGHLALGSKSGARSDEALRETFDLTSDQCDAIFYSFGYRAGEGVGIREVIERIDSLLAGDDIVEIANAAEQQRLYETQED